MAEQKIRLIMQRKKKLDFSSFSRFGGDSWTRTNDPIDVNDMLYRLSHATALCSDTLIICETGRLSSLSCKKLPHGASDCQKILDTAALRGYNFRYGTLSFVDRFRAAGAPGCSGGRCRMQNRRQAPGGDADQCRRLLNRSRKSKGFGANSGSGRIRRSG